MSTMLNLFGLFRKSLNVLVVRTLSALLFVAVVAVDFFMNVPVGWVTLISSFLRICCFARLWILKNVSIFYKKCLDIFFC